MTIPNIASKLKDAENDPGNPEDYMVYHISEVENGYILEIENTGTVFCFQSKSHLMQHLYQELEGE